MRRVYSVIALLCIASPLYGRAKMQGWCEDGGYTVTVPGGAGPSPNKYQRSFPQCQVNVYYAGTTTPAAIYSDNSGTVKANPFTAASDGLWFFYADDGRYDVRFSGGLSPGVPAPFTLGDIPLIDPSSAASEVRNAKQFCTTPGTLDQTCIVNAINSLPPGGGSVYVPRGTYVIGTPGITINKSNVTVYGDGDATILQVVAATSFANNGVFYGLNVSRIHLHDMLLSGGCTRLFAFNPAQKGTYFTATTNISDIILERLHVSGLCGEGLYADVGSGTVGSIGAINFIDNIIEHGAGVNAININTTATTDCLILGNRIDDMETKGIEGPGNNCIISNNVISNVGGDGIFINNYATNAKIRTTISSNRLRNGGTNNGNGGITVCGWGVTVTGNDVTAWTGAGVYLSSCSGGTNRGSNNLVVGNVLHGNSTLGTGYYTAEVVQDAGSDNSIVDNIFYPEGAVAANPIRISTGTSTFISGNNFIGYSGDIVDGGTGTIYGINRPNNHLIKFPGTTPINYTPTIANNTTNNWFTASGRDTFTLCNNMNTSTQDDATKASWCIDFGALNDQFRVRRAAPAGMMTTMFRVVPDSEIGLGDAGPTWKSAVGVPSGVCVTGSLFSRTDGTPGATLYVCENTAWVAK